MQCSVEIGFRNIKIRFATTRFFYLCIGFFCLVEKKRRRLKNMAKETRTLSKQKRNPCNRKKIYMHTQPFEYMFQFGGVLFEIKHNNLPIFWPVLWGYMKMQQKKNPSIVGRRCVKTFEVWKWSERNIKQGCMHCAHMNRSTINPPNHRKFYLCQK